MRPRRSSNGSLMTRRQAVRAAGITLRSPGRTTGSGTRRKSIAWPARRISCATTRRTRSRWRWPGRGWGRGYQLTAQVNRVNPGGAAQTAHRDYHLGFMNADQLATYPIQAHEISPRLTLQGAIAHCDMPVESGPTMLMPYSQRFAEGYVAFGRKEFQEFFAKAHVQLPLEKGDLLFFNPAVMHGAGTNRSQDIRRMGESPADRIRVRAIDRSREPVGNVRGALSGDGRGPRVRFVDVEGSPECHCRLRRGLRVSDKPGPRSACGRPHTEEPGGTDGGGAGARRFCK